MKLYRTYGAIMGMVANVTWVTPTPIFISPLQGFSGTYRYTRLLFSFPIRAINHCV